VVDGVHGGGDFGSSRVNQREPAMQKGAGYYDGEGGAYVLGEG